MCKIPDVLILDLEIIRSQCENEEIIIDYLIASELTPQELDDMADIFSAARYYKQNKLSKT